jgi:hypothetical protein
MRSIYLFVCEYLQANVRLDVKIDWFFKYSHQNEYFEVNIRQSQYEKTLK